MWISFFAVKYAVIEDNTRKTLFLDNNLLCIYNYMCMFRIVKIILFSCERKQDYLTGTLPSLPLSIYTIPLHTYVHTAEANQADEAGCNQVWQCIEAESTPGAGGQVWYSTIHWGALVSSRGGSLSTRSTGEGTSTTHTHLLLQLRINCLVIQ